MSFSISTANILQFGTNVRFLASQQEARLRPAAIVESITGEAAYLEQLAPTGARKVTERHGDSPIMNSQHLRRRVAPYPYDWGDMIDRQDKVRLIIDPAGSYVKLAGYAMARADDDEIIAAFFGTAYTGHTGSTALAWPNGDNESSPTQPGGAQIAVNDWSYGNGSGNVGLTVSKLISASVALDAAEGDEGEERYIALKAKQKGNLLATTEVTSADYNTVRALYDGKIDTFMGFRFLHTERLQVNSSGQTRVPAWRKSAIGLGVAQDTESRASERSDKRFAWYVYCDKDIGATRLEEAKLVEILCA